MIFQRFSKEILKEKPNGLVRFVSGVLALGGYQHKGVMAKVEKIVDGLIRFCGQGFVGEEIGCVLYSCVMLGKYQDVLDICQNVDRSKIVDITSNFTIEFCRLVSLISLGKIVEEKDIEQFKKAEKNFYSLINKQILYNESCIGTPFTSPQLKQKLHNILQKKHGCQTMDENWRITLPEIKTVYFLATYDHLQANTEDSQKQL